MDRAETGRTGEAVAARYYQKQGCELVAHNYRTRMGEIDLILREPDGTLVLCEVKTRSPDPLAAGLLVCQNHRSIYGAADCPPLQFVVSGVDGVKAQQFPTDPTVPKLLR